MVDERGTGTRGREAEGRCEDRGHWWASSVGYEVYLPSYADSDGDGLGDLRGLRARLDHLARLGVDLLWITPFYPSPLHDNGYDVSDYRGVHPRFGTLADLDGLLDDAHALGMRVVIDLVVNHTSSEHPWFVESRASRHNARRNYYIWRDGRPDGSPPNNWVSMFGGSAWTWDEKTRQYWLHLFLPEQPDLNWADPRVAEEVDGVVTFWLDRGVDGLRVDTAHMFVKHPDLPDNPPADSQHARVATGTVAAWGVHRHLHDIDQPEVLEVHRRWRQLTNDYDALLLGEVYLMNPDDVARYLLGGDGLDLSFLFTPVELDWDPAVLAHTLRGATAAVDGRPLFAWVLSSHDSHRAVTRYGGGAIGRERALLVHTLLFALPGLPFLYQGEELGLEDGDIPPDAARDPIARIAGEHASSRDSARTPMPWRSGPGLGFTTSQRPWLPLGERADGDTVQAQEADMRSPLHRYRRLVALRRELRALSDGRLHWLDAPGGVISFSRGNGVLVAANPHDRPVHWTPAAGEWAVRFTSTDAPLRPGILPARTAAIFSATSTTESPAPVR